MPANGDPTGTGVGPLDALDEWVSVPCPACGGRGRRETDVSDTFVDSAWYFLRYVSTEVDDAPWSPDRVRRLLPVDFYAGGPEHVNRHHLYARFTCMALHDLGLLPFEEPFPHVRLGGFIVLDGAKISKSRGNVVTPDEFVEADGADVLRCALLFSAPWEQGGEFQLDAIAGIQRFFAKVWRAVTGRLSNDDADIGADVVDAVAQALERMHFNVGIARLMETVPAIRTVTQATTFLRLLAPFAPHLAEELWARLGGEFSVHAARWPEGTPVDDARRAVEVAVQVDGRVRDRMVVRPGGDVGTLEAEALRRAKVIDAIDGRAVTRVVVVPDRLVNIVTMAQSDPNTADSSVCPPKRDHGRRRASPHG